MNNQYNIVIVETLNDYYVISTATYADQDGTYHYVGKIHYYFMATAAVCFPILNCTLCSHQAFPMPVYFCSRIHELLRGSHVASTFYSLIKMHFNEMHIYFI